MMGMKNKKTQISQIFERGVSTAVSTWNLVDTRKNCASEDQEFGCDMLCPIQEPKWKSWLR